MKKILLSTIFCIFISFAHAQQIPNSGFTNPVRAACALNNNDTVRSFIEWECYQTLNNSWWGVKDSTRCFNIVDTTQSWGGAVININEADSTKIIFFRCKLDSTNKILLDSNDLYNLTLYAQSSNYLLFDTSASCPDGFCSGMMVGVEIPDSSGNGHVMHWYDTPMSLNYLEMCFPTEYFAKKNYLRELILKVKVKGLALNQYLKISQLNLTNFAFDIYKIFDSTSVAPYSNGQFAYYFQQFPQNNFMAMHSYTYPAPNNFTYIDIFPRPNVNIKSTVTMTFNYGTSLTLQPWTDLRGGQVLGDTIRHNLHLIINGGNICMYPFIEIVFRDGDQFSYMNGNVEMEGTNSCFQFAPGAALNVGDGATLHYGHPNTGILLLRDSSTINIGRNAELVIHNTLIMFEHSHATHPGQVYLTLREGSQLTFAKGSHLKNDWSINKAMKLNVYMKGGVLDDSGLPQNERAIINRIYDSPADQLKDNFKLYNNPASSALEYSLVSDGAGQFSLEVNDISGRTVLVQNQPMQKGISFYHADISSLAKGVYFITVRTDSAAATKKFVKN